MRPPIFPLLLAISSTTASAALTTLPPRALSIPVPITIPDPSPDLSIFVRPNLTTFFIPNDPTTSKFKTKKSKKSKSKKRKDESLVLPQIEEKEGNTEPENINLWICDLPNTKGNCVLVNFPRDGYIMRLSADDFWTGKIASMWVQEKGYCEVYSEVTEEGSCGGSGGFITVEYPEGKMDLSKELYPGRWFKPGQVVQRPTRAWDHLVRCVKCWRESSKTNE